MTFKIDTEAAKPRVINNGGHRLIRHVEYIGAEKPHSVTHFSPAEWEAIREQVHLEDLNRDRGLADCEHGAVGNHIATEHWTRDARGIRRCNYCGTANW